MNKRSATRNRRSQRLSRPGSILVLSAVPMVVMAFVCDPTAITGDGANRSYDVGKPVHLVR